MFHVKHACSPPTGCSPTMPGLVVTDIPFSSSKAEKIVLAIESALDRNGAG